MDPKRKGLARHVDPCIGRDVVRWHPHPQPNPTLSLYRQDRIRRTRVVNRCRVMNNAFAARGSNVGARQAADLMPRIIGA